MPKEKICGSCDRNLIAIHSNGKGYQYFFCPPCKKKYSIKCGTILSMAHLSLRKVVLLVYSFIACFWSYKQVKLEVNVSSSEDEGDGGDRGDGLADSPAVLSDRTISRYFTLFRYMMMVPLDSLFLFLFIAEISLGRKC